MAGRQSNTLRGLAREAPFRLAAPAGPPSTTGHFPARIVNDGAIPSTGGKVYAVKPIAVEFVEAEGATLTITEHPTARGYVGDLGEGSRSAGDCCVATQIDGRWVIDGRLARVINQGVTFTVVCGTISSSVAIAGATVTIKLAGSTVATLTTSPVGVAYAPLSPGSYTYEVTKTGYETVTGSFTITAGVNRFVTVTICKTSKVIRFTVGLPTPLCPIAGATIHVTGTATGTLTTDADGKASITLTKPPGSCAWTLSYRVVPPPLRGAACVDGWPMSGTFCEGDIATNVNLPPDPYHLSAHSGQVYWPKLLTYTDPEGTATVNLGSTFFDGYTYTSSNATGLVDCGGGVSRCVPGQTADVGVQVMLLPEPGPTPCDGWQLYVRRSSMSARQLGCSPPAGAQREPDGDAVLVPSSHAGGGTVEPNLASSCATNRAASAVTAASNSFLRSTDSEVRVTPAIVGTAWTASGVTSVAYNYMAGENPGKAIPESSQPFTVTGTVGGCVDELIPLPKGWAFAVNTEGWSWTDTSYAVDSAIWIYTEGSPAAGCLRALEAGIAAGYWEWTGTWEDLGVPAGATIGTLTFTGLRTKAHDVGLVDCSVTFGPLTLHDSGGTLDATLWAGRTATAEETTWTTEPAGTAQAVSPAIAGSGDTIRLRLAISLNGGTLDLPTEGRIDTLGIEIGYSP